MQGEMMTFYYDLSMNNGLGDGPRKREMTQPVYTPEIQVNSFHLNVYIGLEVTQDGRIVPAVAALPNHSVVGGNGASLVSYIPYDDMPPYTVLMSPHIANKLMDAGLLTHVNENVYQLTQDAINCIPPTAQIDYEEQFTEHELCE